jgi:methionyl-tRNA formyltransferase
MKTLFIGSTKRGLQTLTAIIEAGHTVCGVISLLQDPHEVDHYEEPIRYLAERHNIPIFETRWMKEQDYVSLVRDELKPDIALVVGCRLIIPEAIYTLPPLGTLAVHDSLLPEYRGFAPLNWAIINGETEGGVTLFYLNPLMDGGDIVGQKQIPIGPHDTGPEIYKKVCRDTVDLVIEYWPRLAEGTAPRLKQDYNSGSFTCSRTPTDGMIDWSSSTGQIYNLIRALTYPYPGAFTFFRGERVVIRKALLLEAAPLYRGRIPGRVVRVEKVDGFVDVLTSDGMLRIHEVECQGKLLPAAEVITSVKERLGIDIFQLQEQVRELQLCISELVQSQKEEA